MRYNAKNMIEIKAGTYFWTVIGAIEKTSQSGYDYISLDLIVFVNGPKNEPITVKYVSLSSHPGMLWKVKQFCQAIGHDFDANDLTPADCLDANGWAEFDFGKPSQTTGNRYLEPKRFLHDESLKDFLAALPKEGEDDVPSDSDNDTPVSNVLLSDDVDVPF